jgi:uncharacterized protein
MGVIVFGIPRAAFCRFLQRIVAAGCGNRVLFGSGQMDWSEVIERAITVIEEAPFLSGEQKCDILYSNAVCFPRLSEEEIRRHHSR